MKYVLNRIFTGLLDVLKIKMFHGSIVFVVFPYKVTAVYCSLHGVCGVDKVKYGIHTAI